MDTRDFHRHRNKIAGLYPDPAQYISWPQKLFPKNRLSTKLAYPPPRFFNFPHLSHFCTKILTVVIF